MDIFSSSVAWSIMHTCSRTFFTICYSSSRFSLSDLSDFQRMRSIGKALERHEMKSSYPVSVQHRPTSTGATGFPAKQTFRSSDSSPISAEAQFRCSSWRLVASLGWTCWTWTDGCAVSMTPFRNHWVLRISRRPSKVFACFCLFCQTFIFIRGAIPNHVHRCTVSCSLWLEPCTFCGAAAKVTSRQAFGQPIISGMSWHVILVEFMEWLWTYLRGTRKGPAPLQLSLTHPFCCLLCSPALLPVLDTYYI